MANVIRAKKPRVAVDPNGSGVIRVDGETIVILRDMAYQAICRLVKWLAF